MTTPTKQTKNKKKTLRPMHPPFVVAAPKGTRIRGALHLTDSEEIIIRHLVEHLGKLRLTDLSKRCQVAREATSIESTNKHLNRAERKKELTPESSSRWAGSITAENDNLWELSYDNMQREYSHKQQAAKAIRKRLAHAIGSKKGYKTIEIHKEKRRRLQIIESRMAELKHRIENADVSICKGGKKLANTRHNLKKAKMSKEEWEAIWKASRYYCTAYGDSQYEHGNGLISIDPMTGICEITLPKPLKHLANAPRGRYRLENPVKFKQKGAGKWAVQADTGSVRYDISYNAEKRRWYIDASWSVTPRQLPSIDALRNHPTIGIDLNADHVACWVVAPDGNPIGAPVAFEYLQEGSTETRDGRLREIITQILDLASSHNCASVTVENLNFEPERAVGKDNSRHRRGRSGRRMRKVVFGIPTARFRDRLAGMAYHRSIAVIAVDPAYTSKWGRKYWYQYLNRTRNHPSSSHDAAALVIARRGKRVSAKRRAVEPSKRESAQRSMGDKGFIRDVDSGSTPARLPSSDGAPNDASDMVRAAVQNDCCETLQRVIADKECGQGFRTVQESPVVGDYQPLLFI